MRYSIIIPVYNAERYLDECLESVCTQTYGDWECICVDDGSCDRSGEILRNYAVRDARFKCLKQSHAGVGVTRTRGLAAATGDYCLFVDADDSLMPDALKDLQDETADIVTFLPLKGMKAERYERVPEKATLFFSSLAGNMLGWNALYRRKLIVDLKFPALINCEDLVFAAEAYTKAETVVAGVKPWYCHRLVVGSSYNSHSWRRVVDSYKSLGMMRRAYAPIAKTMKMRAILFRKLSAHFVLHVLAEIPRVISRNRHATQKGMGAG